jgi:AraC family transcriptional regulator of adaptative response/methylated-DNA-[protein]-cysteine methyltransferase
MSHARPIVYAHNPVESDPRYARIVARDRSADGRFWYSVSTTGVYCKPSCASRLAKPRNVAIHDSAEAAHALGFRPCKRCRPDRPSLDVENAAIVTRACRSIETSDDVPSLRELAASVGRSSSHFHRLFRAKTGVTPRDYAAAHRTSRVRETLLTRASVTQAIFEAGFSSSGRFYTTSRDVLGMTPARYRAGGANETIRFAVGESSLGAILVATSEIGVAAILIGADPEALVRDLQERFPNADLIGGDDAFESFVARVVGFVESPAIGLDLPLDVRGTVFQRRVWKALCAIPAGRTASYSEIAAAIGAPKAARAVASACAANALAVAIPCHRVVRNDGSLSGYAWGVDRKRALIDREAARSSE